MKNVKFGRFWSQKSVCGSKKCSRSRGQTLVEYALILAVVSLVVFGVIVNLGQTIKGFYSTIGSAVGTAAAMASH